MANYKLHGLSKHPLYIRYYKLLDRCYNKKSSRYNFYGAKGITVCDEWNSFEPFMKWSLENGFQQGLVLDRKNPQLGYSPNNCQWITETQNGKKVAEDRYKKELYFFNKFKMILQNVEHDEKEKLLKEVDDFLIFFKPKECVNTNGI